MSLVLVKEDGSGKVDANTYALVADGDSYHDGDLYGSAWTDAATTSKEKSLVMATRIIDAFFRFNGFKRMVTQALQWPRRECQDPDDDGGIVPAALLIRGGCLDETKVPTLVVQATCEMARELLEADRTDNPMGEGLRTLRVEGALTLEFDSKDKQPAVTRLVQSMLGKYGEYVGNTSGTVRLVRV
jgi:hypothetical protein